MLARALRQEPMHHGARELGAAPNSQMKTKSADPVGVPSTTFFKWPKTMQTIPKIQHPQSKIQSQAGNLNRKLKIQNPNVIFQISKIVKMLKIYNILNSKVVKISKSSKPKNCHKTKHKQHPKTLGNSFGFMIFLQFEKLLNFVIVRSVCKMVVKSTDQNLTQIQILLDPNNNWAKTKKLGTMRIELQKKSSPLWPNKLITFHLSVHTSKIDCLFRIKLYLCVGRKNFRN